MPAVNLSRVAHAFVTQTGSSYKGTAHEACSRDIVGGDEVEGLLDVIGWGWVGREANVKFGEWLVHLADCVVQAVCVGIDEVELPGFTTLAFHTYCNDREQQEEHCGPSAGGKAKHFANAADRS